MASKPSLILSGLPRVHAHLRGGRPIVHDLRHPGRERDRGPRRHQPTRPSLAHPGRVRTDGGRDHRGADGQGLGQRIRRARGPAGTDDDRGPREHRGELLQRDRMRHHAVQHPGGRCLGAQPCRFRAFAGDQQLQPRARPGDGEEGEQQVLVAAIGTVAGRGRHHPTDGGVEHRRERPRRAEVLIDLEEAAQDRRRRRWRALGNEALVHRRAAAERAAGQSRRPGGQPPEVVARDLNDDRQVEEAAHDGRLDVALARVEERGTDPVQLAGKPDDAVAGHALQAVAILAQRLRHVPIRSAHERDPAHHVPHVPPPMTPARRGSAR